jgi:hypothetical protein
MRGLFQCLWYESSIGQREAKGIKMILEERGCYPKEKLRAKYTSPKCEALVTYPPPANKPPCCLARILQNHKDFREQKSALAELIEGRGHKCIFLPKFHCELNLIEMY